MKKNVKLYSNPLFAERFRTLMSNRNVRLNDIAEIAGCAVSTASTWRRGRMPRKYQTVEKIAEFLSVDASYLSGESDNGGFMPLFSNSKPEGEPTAIGREIRAHIEKLVAASDVSALKRLKAELEKNFPVDAGRRLASPGAHQPEPRTKARRQA